jgi:AcrR family transcriptional regulator
MQQHAGSRTRARLIAAFNQLVFDKTRGPIRVAQIIEKAGVGRSTFYDHFANAEAVHMAALSRPMAQLADPAAGTGTVEQLQWLLDHFHGNRGRARDVLLGSSRDRITRLLADMIDERIDAGDDLAIPRRIATMQIAEAILGPIRLWIAGEFAASSGTLAASLFETAAAMRASLGLKPKHSPAALANGSH